MRNKNCRTAAALSVACAMAAAIRAESGGTEDAPAITLKNEVWELKIEPRWGARASSMRSLADGHEFVTHWGEPSREKDGGMTRGGGILRSMMSGSYRSSQPEEPYTVVRCGPAEALLVYENRHPLLDGLREERRIALEGREVVFAVKVTNAGRAARVMYYRMQDYAGVGRCRGRDTVFVVPKEAGMPVAFTAQPGVSVARHFLLPEEPWYALADLVDDRGLRVTLRKAPPADIFFWVGNAEQRTAEVFFPQARLEPGQSWEMEARYGAFAPSAPRLEEKVAAAEIDGYLEGFAGKALRKAPPLNAAMTLPDAAAPVNLVPMHPADRALGGRFAPDYGRTLLQITLYGTPGEAVPLAFAATARKPVKTGRVAFGDLKQEQSGRRIAAAAYDPKYVAGDSQVLVYGWELSRNLPETAGMVNNDITDAAALTPFTLRAGESAYLWSNLTIPADAAPGRYRGTCRVELDGGAEASFEIALEVRPFKLAKAEHKTYGTFFVYYLRPDRAAPDAPNAQGKITRAQYLEILKAYGDAGCNGFALYVGARDDLLWVLDRKRELGMNGADVLISPWEVTPADLAQRGMTAYAWGVDEPSRYSQIPGTTEKYKRLTARGWRPTFTPNLPLGLLMADQLEKMVPIINCNGNAAYLMEASRRYKGQGRAVYWYECYGLGLPSVEQRALRGIYLWKEPVDGIYDWDNGGGYKTLGPHNMIAFAGCRPLARLGLENTRQALYDLHYLHTLETLAKASAAPVVRAEAERLMSWVRTRFDSDYHRVMPYITDPQYLDDVRQRVAEVIEKLTAAAAGEGLAHANLH